MAVLEEVVEVCPHCGHENIHENLDPVAAGYKAMCKECCAEMIWFRRMQNEASRKERSNEIS